MSQVDSVTPPEDEQALEALREILVGHYRERVTDLNGELDQVHSVLTSLEAQINDKDALIETITPIMADSIRTSIHESRDEMVEAFNPIIAESIRTSVTDSSAQMIDALYPIMGRLVRRAVTEAMQDLARKIDSQMRRTLNFDTIKQIFVAQAQGISSAEMTIRDSLPFEVLEIFLVHRETGIMLLHLTGVEDELANSEIDSELISGMLTAIQDFVQDAFGRGEEGNLNEIHHGGKEILIETTQMLYIAVISEGIEPMGYRANVREMIYEIDQRYNRTLRHFDGDTSEFSAVRAELGSLMTTEIAQSRTVEIDGQLPGRENINPRRTALAIPSSPKRDERTLLLFAVTLILVFSLIYLVFG